MINLLPQAEKKKLQKEFRLRYGVVTLLVLFGLECLAFVSFVPSYIALSNSTAKMGADLAAMKTSSPPGGEATQNDLNVIKSEITLLKSGGSKEAPPSQLLSLLLAQKPSGISISRFTYARTDAGVSAQLSGNAGKPEDLILFRKLLKDDKDHVKDARYAQSFINKKSDIDFLLTVDLK
jgi:hypothetical protein